VAILACPAAKLKAEIAQRILLGIVDSYFLGMGFLVYGFLLFEGIGALRLGDFSFLRRSVCFIVI
jgi:hypothetical protein